MGTKRLYVWNGSADDKLDLLRYVHATEKDVMRQPVVEARIAALEAALREREAECERLRSKLEQRDYEIASMLKRQANE